MPGLGLQASTSTLFCTTMATTRLRQTFRVPAEESYSDDEVLDEEGNEE